MPNKYTLFRAQRVASKLFCKIEAGLIFICKRSERNESLLSFPSGAPQTKNTPPACCGVQRASAASIFASPELALESILFISARSAFRLWRNLASQTNIKKKRPLAIDLFFDFRRKEKVILASGRIGEAPAEGHFAFGRTILLAV